MTVTTFYGFPLMAENQSSKYITHNDAIIDIDTTLHGLAGAPASPGIVLSTGTVFGTVTIDPTLTFSSSTLSLSLGHTNAWTKSQRVTPVTLATSGSIAPDFSASNNFSTTLSATSTLANPTNVNAGQAGQIIVIQGGAGSYTLSYGSSWKFAGGTSPTLSTTVGAIDILSYYVIDSTHIAVSASLNFS